MRNTDVTMEMQTLMKRVTAKPWIEPEPRYQRTAAAIIVVMLESITAERAFEKPALTAFHRMPFLERYHPSY